MQTVITGLNEVSLEQKQVSLIVSIWSGHSNNDAFYYFWLFMFLTLQKFWSKTSIFTQVYDYFWWNYTTFMIVALWFLGHRNTHRDFVLTWFWKLRTEEKLSHLRTRFTGWKISRNSRFVYWTRDYTSGINEGGRSHQQ